VDALFGANSSPFLCPLRRISPVSRPELTTASLKVTALAHAKVVGATAKGLIPKCSIVIFSVQNGTFDFRKDTN
jgi:hypothetical protein